MIFVSVNLLVSVEVLHFQFFVFFFLLLIDNKCSCSEKQKLWSYVGFISFE
jgi:hypothetical protein